MKYFAAILVLAACAYAQTSDEKTEENRPSRATYPVGTYPTAYVHPGAAYVQGAAYAPAAYAPAAYAPAAYPTAYYAPAATAKTAQYQYVAPHAGAYVPHYAAAPVVAQPAYYPAGVKAVHV